MESLEHLRELVGSELLAEPPDDAAEVRRVDVALALGVEDLEGVGEQLSLLASDRVHLATALAIPPHALVGRPRVALAGVALAQRRLPVERRDQRGGPLVAHDLVLLQVGVRAGDGHLGHIGALDPVVLEQSARSQALARVQLEKLPDQILGVVRHVTPCLVCKRHLAALDGSAHLRVGATWRVERVATREDNVEDHAERPHVHLLAVARVGEHLGRPVSPRALPLRESAVLPERDRQPEVADLDRQVALVGRRQQQVLGLEVAVADALRVEPRDSLSDLLHQDRRLLLTVGAVLHQLLEELAARHELHHEVPLGLGLEDIEEVDDVLVRAHAPQDLDLAPDGRAVRARFLDRLDGHGLARLAMRRAADRREVAVAEHLAHLVHLLQRRWRLLLLCRGRRCRRRCAVIR
mmetsp:Transcript_86935/g.261154  ORF Transcript_86935/g.261154 Transcript_86935/m.261154 type:complete len:409 (-) Transcript_86935:277-1503(-)